LLPYILGGFAFGSGYYVISKLVHNEDSSIMSNRLKMNVPFGGVLMATVIHPNLWWLGCLMGLLGVNLLLLSSYYHIIILSYYHIITS
jgi:hypothetical protein